MNKKDIFLCSTYLHENIFLFFFIHFWFAVVAAADAVVACDKNTKAFLENSLHMFNWM